MSQQSTPVAHTEKIEALWLCVAREASEHTEASQICALATSGFLTRVRDHSAISHLQDLSLAGWNAMLYGSEAHDGEAQPRQPPAFCSWMST